MPRALTLATLAVLTFSSAGHAQSLRERFSDLFTFGTCGQPLCLDLDNEHGSHFLPDVAAGNLTVIAFLTEAMARSTATTPIGATSSGATFSVVGGLPVRTSTSAGPVFGERSQTLGRGRFFLGANVSAVSFTTLNGDPLDNLVLNFAHQDVGNPGLGDPVFENDVIRLDLGLNIDLLLASVIATWGISDFVDLGVAVPFVRTSLRGVSTAQVEPFGYPTAHFFGGDLANPVVRATSSMNASAAGLGDVVGRLKVNLGQGSKGGAALLAEVRFPTGDEENLLGAGATSARGLGIVALQFGNFSPHANAGYLVRTGALQSDAVLANLGFDNLMTPWATLAFDLISEWRVGESKLPLPGVIQFATPIVRQVPATSFPERREDRLDASLGVKFTMRGGTVLLVNGIIPLRKAGLQPDFLWTGGIEFGF
ncbi:MAG TPA: hypothetical protein VF970_07645 [Gemmatimonadales bacterium]